MRRSLLFSCALHGVIVLIALATPPRRAARESIAPMEIAFDAAVAVGVDDPAHAGGGGPPRPAEPVVSARVHRRAPMALRLTAAVASSAPAPALAAPTEDGQVEVTPGAPAVGASESSEPVAGTGDGTGAGDGLGEAFGDGFGPGAGGKAMSRELHARVLGNEVLDVRPRADAPTISHEEATALRVRDRFPRLPESVWPEWRPYIVRLEICVAEDGRVREAVLRSSASPRLDPIVLAAAKTWQYRPRVVDGKPAPFCHGVVIKYERW